jgi:hypothetical protein
MRAYPMVVAVGVVAGRPVAIGTLINSMVSIGGIASAAVIAIEVIGAAAPGAAAGATYFSSLDSFILVIENTVTELKCSMGCL